MTNEEAISIINSCVQADTEEVNEALDMAVTALEQQPCEDCISRAEVLKIIDFEDKWLYDIWFHGDLCLSTVDTAFGGLRGRVKDLPSVYPKAKGDN